MSLQLSLGVYEDPECTIPVINVIWGECWVGEWKEKIIYVRNETIGGIASLMYTVYINNIIPYDLGPYLIMRTDNGGYDRNDVWQPKTLFPQNGEVIPLKLWLMFTGIPPTFPTEFYFDMKVEANLACDANRDGYVSKNDEQYINLHMGETIMPQGGFYIPPPENVFYTDGYVHRMWGLLADLNFNLTVDAQDIDVYQRDIQEDLTRGSGGGSMGGGLKEKPKRAAW